MENEFVALQETVLLKWLLVKVVNNMGNFPQAITSILTKQLIVRKEFFEKKISSRTVILKSTEAFSWLQTGKRQ